MTFSVDDLIDDLFGTLSQLLLRREVECPHCVTH